MLYLYALCYFPVDENDAKNILFFWPANEILMHLIDTNIHKIIFVHTKRSFMFTWCFAMNKSCSYNILSLTHKRNVYAFESLKKRHSILTVLFQHVRVRFLSKCVLIDTNIHKILFWAHQMQYLYTFMLFSCRWKWLEEYSFFDTQI